uniref:ARAD1C10450p n=1 Tax=Blastobotrys adeninivorans TaxID=409370 RepID=A0A060SZR4_BLAAD
MTEIFSATTSEVAHIASVLRAIGSVSDVAAITISDQGLRVSVDNGTHSCQAHLFLMDKLFVNYVYNPRGEEEEEQDGSEQLLTVHVSLKAINQCLRMFSSSAPSGSQSSGSMRASDAMKSTSEESGKSGGGGKLVTKSITCRFSYSGPGHPFLLYFKEGRNLSTLCEFTTYEDYGALDMIELDLDNIVQKIIIKGQYLEDAIGELESLGTEVVTVRASSLVAPHFSLASQGDMGESMLSFPNERSILETFVVETDHVPAGQNVTVANSYQYNLIKMSRPALTIASRVSLRCDDNGFMSLQSMVELGDGRHSFIDFRFRPNE